MKTNKVSINNISGQNCSSCS